MSTTCTSTGQMKKITTPWPRRRSRILVWGDPVEFWPQGGGPWAQNLLKIGVFPLKLPENGMIKKKSWGQRGTPWIRSCQALKLSKEVGGFELKYSFGFGVSTVNAQCSLTFFGPGVKHSGIPRNETLLRRGFRDSSSAGNCKFFRLSEKKKNSENNAFFEFEKIWDDQVCRQKAICYRKQFATCGSLFIRMCLIGNWGLDLSKLLQNCSQLSKQFSKPHAISHVLNYTPSQNSPKSKDFYLVLLFRIKREVPVFSFHFWKPDQSGQWKSDTKKKSFHFGILWFQRAVYHVENSSKAQFWIKHSNKAGPTCTESNLLLFPLTPIHTGDEWEFVPNWVKKLPLKCMSTQFGTNCNSPLVWMGLSPG